MEKKESKIKHCGICETDAMCLCFDCYNYFCESCFKFVHEKGKGKSNHIKEKIDPYLPFNFRCPEHQRGLLDLFCIEEKELCCSYCYYENLHKGHIVLRISDEEILKKNNINLEYSTKIFNDIINNIKTLKQKIEEEINKINILYEETNTYLTKVFQEKHEKLLKEENDIREKLQNEVTKTKEKLEYYFTETNNEIILNERINLGLKKLEKVEKNNLRILSYISQINNNNKKMIKLSNEIIKGKKFYFNEKENNIIYEEYIFNGLPLINNIQFNNITGNSLNISWNINNKEFKNENISYIIEMKEENTEEKFIEIYKGNDTNYKAKNLLPNKDYEFRICSASNDNKGPLSEIQKIKTKNGFYELDNSAIIKNEEEKNKIIEWVSTEIKIRNIKLIYRATENGDTSKKFFEKIKNKGPIISFIETKEKKRFGGFTKVDWKDGNHEGNINDPNSFLFSLDNQRKYKILKPKQSFTCYNGYTLVYGNNGDGKGAYLPENFFKKESREDQSTKVYDVPSDYCLTGQKNFMVNEAEVFQIIFE